MKAIKSLVVAAIAAAGVALVADAQAAGRTGGAGHWSGGHGSGGHWSGGHWRGGHWGGHYWGPSLAFAFGVPLLWSSWYWPGYYGYYYPPRVIYRDVYPDGAYDATPPATTEVPRSEGAPTQAPAYMHYCASAKAYFPKVTTCPEGWRFEPAR
jgi:hypothetical protein